MSPQHWAQTQKDRKPTFGTGEWTDAEKCVLYWDQKCYKKTIYLDTGRSNVATMRLAPGYHAFKAFCAEAEVDDIFGYDFNPLIAEAAEISDDDESVVDPHDDLDSQEGWSSDKSQSTDHDVWHTEKLRTFNLVGKTSSPPNPVVIVDEEDKTRNQTPTTELLLYHYGFGHISFTKLQLMAKFGVLPKCLATCNVPVCSACMYAKATKRPWRAKTKNINIPIRTPPPGDVISVDQMESPVPGLVAQMTGFLTKQHYRYATVFVDQATRLGYVYLQKSATAEETILAKQAFEQFAANRGVTQIKHTMRTMAYLRPTNGFNSAAPTANP